MLERVNGTKLLCGSAARELARIRGRRTAMLDRGRQVEVGYRHERERGDVRRRPGWFGVRIDYIGLSEE